MENLILTGSGWNDYAVSAAAALKALGGNAEVVGVSKRRLPEYLDDLEKGVRRIWILGVSLGGDEERLAGALKTLKKRGASVTWISVLDAGETQKAKVFPLMKPLVIEADKLLDAVGDVFEIDVEKWRPFACEESKVAVVRDYHELFAAAQFFHRYYQDDAVYASAVRLLAEGVDSKVWSDGTKRAVEHYRRYKGRELVGKSLQMRTLQERINRIAKFPNARVLILGESGTGKETVAQQIHNKSPRARENFIAFNCASVNPQLLESRFFGYEQGSFTGAEKRTDGLFTLANGGTLFLDEIGELPLEAQGVLLRVLEGGRFMRVGGKEELSSDVRLVTATNRDLPARVREGKFRADLFQRLNVVQLRIPALREHKEDIHDIADGWWLGQHHRHLSAEQVAALMEYDYPGNVRELLNILDRATVLGETDFAALMREHKEMNAGLADPVVRSRGAVPDELEAAIKLHVRHVYDKYGQNLTATAKALNVARNTVRKYLDT